MKRLADVKTNVGEKAEIGVSEMQTLAVVGSGLEEVATSRLDGCLFRQSAFERDPRLAGLVSSSLAEFNDLPPNLTRLMEVLQDQLSDAKTIAKVVELNPALAAKVLKLVNSSFAGLRGKVSNLKRAVTILGMNHIRSLILGTSVFMRHRHHKLPPTLPLDKLWKHSVAVSQIAGAIGDALGNLDSATLVSAGLLHDAGLLVLASIHPPKFASCIDQAENNGGSLIESELYTIGVAHPMLSGTLGTMWNLPRRLVDLMMYQSHPDKAADPKLITVLRLAEYIARTNEIGKDGQKPDDAILDNTADVLDVPPEKVTRMVEYDKMAEIEKNIHIISTWE